MAATTLRRITHANNGVSTCCRSSINVQKRCLCSIRAQSRPSQGCWLVLLAACFLGPRCAGLGLHCRTPSIPQPSSGLGEGGTASRRGTSYFGCRGQWLADPTKLQFGILCDLCRAWEGVAPSWPGLCGARGHSDGGDFSSPQRQPLQRLVPRRWSPAGSFPPQLSSRPTHEGQILEALGCAAARRRALIPLLLLFVLS